MRRHFFIPLTLCFTLALGVFFVNRYVRTQASSAARLTEINVQKFNASQLTDNFDAPAAWKSIETTLTNQGASPQSTQNIVKTARQRSINIAPNPTFNVKFRPVFVRRGSVDGKAVWMIQLVASNYLGSEGRCFNGYTSEQIQKITQSCTYRMLLFDAQSPHEKIFEADYVR